MALAWALLDGSQLFDDDGNYAPDEGEAEPVGARRAAREAAFARHGGQWLAFTAEAELEIFASWLPECIVPTQPSPGSEAEYSHVVAYADYVGFLGGVLYLDTLGGETLWGEHVMRVTRMYALFHRVRALRSFNFITKGAWRWADALALAVRELQGADRQHFVVGASAFACVQDAGDFAEWSALRALTLEQLCDGEGQLTNWARLTYCMHVPLGSAHGAHAVSFDEQWGDLRRAIDDSGAARQRIGRGCAAPNARAIAGAVARAEVPLELRQAAAT